MGLLFYFSGEMGEDPNTLIGQLGKKEEEKKGRPGFFLLPPNKRNILHATGISLFIINHLRPSKIFLPQIQNPKNSV
jgi:hypothetical protein